MNYKVFGTPGCPYCVMAVDLLEARDLQYEYVNLMDDDEAREAFVERQFKTVPQVYVEDSEAETGWSHIGGYTELRERLTVEL